MCYYNEHGEELTDWELEEQFDDMLDEVYGDVEIAGLMYTTSRALSELDPTAYRCSFLDWINAQMEDQLLFEEPPVDTDED